MRYGMTFAVDMYDFESGEESHLVAMPGDYIRMGAWADKELPAADGPDDAETVRILRRNYAIVWHALKRLGRLAEFGLPETLDVAAIDAMADRFAVDVNELREGDLPLAKRPAK